MRSTCIILSALISLGILCQAQSSRPIPDGLRHAKELNASLPVPNSQVPVDAMALKHDAEELSNLAASVPTDVQSVSKGLISKDLIQKLKQIEKLSKRLRNQLDR